MSGTSIERLTLDVPSMPAADARRLGLLVAAGLARATGGIAGAAEFASVRIGVEAARSGGLEALADRIVAEALRQIGRSG